MVPQDILKNNLRKTLEIMHFKNASIQRILFKDTVSAADACTIRNAPVEKRAGPLVQPLIALPLRFYLFPEKRSYKHERNCQKTFRSPVTP